MKDLEKAAGEKVNNSIAARLQRWMKINGSSSLDESSNYTSSEQCKEDMKLQGAESHTDMIFDDQSLFYGRPASEGEMKNAEYGKPASKSVGGKDAAKMVKYGEETFESTLEKAKAAEDLDMLDMFVKNCAHSLASDGEPLSK